MAVMQLLGSFAGSLLGGSSGMFGGGGSNAKEKLYNTQRSFYGEVDEKTRKNLLDLEEQKILRDQKLNEEQAEIAKKINKRKTENLLKRNVASQKAAFGASGIGNKSRSVDAVLEGIRLASKQGYQDFIDMLKIEQQKQESDTNFALSRNLLEKKQTKDYKDIKTGDYRLEKIKDYLNNLGK
jgi:hypothetical protein